MVICLDCGHITVTPCDIVYMKCAKCEEAPQPGLVENEGGLSFDELVIACRNIGYDLTCGECASLFFTRYSSAPHDKLCKTQRSM